MKVHLLEVKNFEDDREATGWSGNILTTVCSKSIWMSRNWELLNRTHVEKNVTCLRCLKIMRKK